MSTLANRTHLRTNQVHGIVDLLLKDIATPPEGYTQAELDAHYQLYADLKSVADKHPKPIQTKPS